MRWLDQLFGCFKACAGPDTADDAFRPTYLAEPPHHNKCVGTPVLDEPREDMRPSRRAGIIARKLRDEFTQEHLDQIAFKLLGVRRAVAEHAQAMERALAAHDATKGEHGWEDCDVEYLIDKLSAKHATLVNASLGDRERIVEACVDLSNYAMMLSRSVS